MMAFVLSPVGRALAGALAVLAALWLYGAKIRMEERARVEAEQAEAIKRESERRLAAIDAARKEAERLADALASERAARARLVGEIDHASRASDGRSCLSADSVRRLDALGRDGDRRAPERAGPRRAATPLRRPAASP